MTHPLKHPDADVACRWMAEHGVHSAGDAEVMAEVLESMPFQGKPLPPFPVPNLWDVVD